MGALATGSVILVRFPFSDLPQTKLRPAVILADCGRGDWLLCQITSNPYSDFRAIRITDADFSTGSLRAISFARPTKNFTAHQSLIAPMVVGVLHEPAFGQIIDAIIRLLKPKV